MPDELEESSQSRYGTVRICQSQSSGCTFRNSVLPQKGRTMLEAWKSRDQLLFSLQVLTDGLALLAPYF